MTENKVELFLKNLFDKTISVWKNFQSYRSKPVRYIADRSFIEAWIEKIDEDGIYTKLFVDLLAYLKTRDVPVITFVLTETLDTMEKENKKYISTIPFKKFLNSLFSIKTVNPDKVTPEIEAVSVLAEKYKEQNCKCIILTLNKALYSFPEDDEHILVLKPAEILGVFVLFYNMIPELSSLYRGWLSNLGNWTEMPKKETFKIADKEV